MRALTVLLAAEEAAGARVLDLVAKSPHRLTGVCTSSPAVEALSAEAGVPVHDAARVTEAGFAEQAGVDLLLNVHSLHIVHPAVLAAPRLGAFNLHPGPLPEYAGLSVPSWAIYNGERSHGVTVHRMEADVDAGDVAFAERFDDRRARHRPHGERDGHAPGGAAGGPAARGSRGRRRAGHPAGHRPPALVPALRAARRAASLGAAGQEDRGLREGLGLRAVPEPVGHARHAGRPRRARGDGGIRDR